MLYCDACRLRRGLPDTIIRKIGNCKYCGGGDLCNDLPQQYVDQQKQRKRAGPCQK